ncbi:hypothetical protein H311_01089 [Anncaliia algerae PRA109]|nr:hypothetical protein H311_01089 [Anncaliia algerae PRA109]
MGSICSVCLSKKSFDISIVGTDQEKRESLYKFITKGHTLKGQYQEIKLKNYKYNYSLKVLNTDLYSADISDTLTKFSQGVFFVCDLTKQSYGEVITEFENYLSHFVKNKCFVIVFCYVYTPAEEFEQYASLNSFKLVYISPEDDEIKKFKLGFNWMENNFSMINNK